MKTVFGIFAMIFSSVLSFVLGIASCIIVGCFLKFYDQKKENSSLTKNNEDPDTYEEKEEPTNE